MTFLIEARDITKRFPGVVALDSVSLGVRAGSVHAVVGENGAGKSTLMKILSGVYRADGGEIRFDGEPVAFHSPRAAERAGIVIIHQELSLVPALSVAENIFLGRERSRLGFVASAAMERRAAEILARLGHPLDPRAVVSSLKVSEQQIVEIARALLLDARVLVMDEPTTALASEDVARLFTIIRSLVQTGTAVIYISHKMDELFRIAGEFTVLRDGRPIGHRAAADTNVAELVRMMVGREVVYTRREHGGRTDDELLRVEHLGSPAGAPRSGRRLADIGFNLRAGEVLGVAGLMGAGRTELLESLFGVRPTDSGTRVTMAGRAITVANPRQAIQSGLAFVSEDRRAQGLVFDLDVAGNITLACLSRFTRLGFVQGGSEATTAAASVERLRIRAPGIRAATANLSGGNQQKVVVARWLLTGPKVLLLDEPTKGIDVNGKAEIYRLIEDLAERGVGVVLVSSELPELLALSDRILVLREGRLAGTLDRAAATEERIMSLATHDERAA